MTPVGLPHSDISGSTPACGSPELIAANHVLRSLLTPRHSPCALSSLATNLFRVGDVLPPIQFRDSPSQGRDRSSRNELDHGSFDARSVALKTRVFSRRCSTIRFSKNLGATRAPGAEPKTLVAFASA